MIFGPVTTYVVSNIQNDCNDILPVFSQSSSKVQKCSLYGQHHTWFMTSLEYYNSLRFFISVLIASVSSSVNPQTALSLHCIIYFFLLKHYFCCCFNYNPSDIFYYFISVFDIIPLFTVWEYVFNFLTRKLLFTNSPDDYTKRKLLWDKGKVLRKHSLHGEKQAMFY